jgi:hypothetical protein
MNCDPPRAWLERGTRRSYSTNTLGAVARGAGGATDRETNETVITRQTDRHRAACMPMRMRARQRANAARPARCACIDRERTGGDCRFATHAKASKYYAA